LAEKATAGEWWVYQPQRHYYIAAGGLSFARVAEMTYTDGFDTKHNAELIAAAVNWLRTDAPALLARLEACEADKARMDWLEQRMVEIHKPNGRRDVCGARSGLRQFIDTLTGREGSG
jgi:hypothetical protein